MSNDNNGHPSGHELDDICSREQLAHELGVDVRTIDNWRLTQGLPFIKVGRRVMFSRSAVMRFLEGRAGLQGDGENCP